MTKRVSHAGLQIDKQLADFVANEAVQDLDISAEAFWQACANVLNAHRDTNKALLEKREKLQAKIDESLDDGLTAQERKKQASWHVFALENPVRKACIGIVSDARSTPPPHDTRWAVSK